MDFNPYDHALHADPYPTYRVLRDEHPAYWNDRLRFWALSRYDDVLAALRAPATFSSAGGITIDARGQEFKPMMITMDPPQHTRLRNLVAKAFTPRRVAEPLPPAQGDGGAGVRNHETRPGLPAIPPARRDEGRR